MKLVLLALLLGASSASATTIQSTAMKTVFGPTEVGPGSRGSLQKSYNFTSTASTSSELFIKNGDGADLRQKECTGSDKVSCKLRNAVNACKVKFSRPSSLDISLNGVAVVSKANYNPAAPSLSLRVTTLASNKLDVNIKGGKRSDVTIRVNAPATVQNQLPLAKMTVTPTQGFSPLIISGNAAASSDPDGKIAKYVWNFGDGIAAEGVLVNHTYFNAGEYTVTLTVHDDKGATATTTTKVKAVQNQLPSAKLALTTSGEGFAPLIVMFDGSKSTDPEGDALKYNWDFGDGTVVDGASKETHTFKSVGNFKVTLKVKDEYGNQASASVNVVVKKQEVPAPVEEQAPSLGELINPTFEEKISFLYEGENPIQKDVDVSKLDQKRLAVVRGRILDEQGNPLSGVTVKFPTESTFGYTTTRANGEYDMAFNSGGNIVVSFNKNGYAPSLRKVSTHGQDFHVVDDVRLVKLDSKVSKVALGANQDQLIIATKQSDSSGERTASIYIPPRTSGQIILPDGSVKNVDSLSVRVTEYTVGDEGPKHMPADLPKASAYTYAVEISSDEALAFGAKSVKFDKPVSYYVDNYLKVPVGAGVPSGYLSPDSGIWIAEKDGIVLKVISKNSVGLAEIDMGSGAVATAADLAKLGIDQTEQKVIATRFAAGDSFWRMPLRHFSTYDFNYSAYPYEMDKTVISNQNDSVESKVKTEDCAGCIISVENQTVGEVIPLVGADGTLSYSSVSAYGRRSTAAFSGNVIGPTLSPLLKRIEVIVKVAGRSISVPAELKPNSRFSYIWDGKDAYGRPVYGEVEATVSVNYYYPTRYAIDYYDDSDSSFGRVRAPGYVSAYYIFGPGETSYSNTTELKVRGTEGTPALAKLRIGSWSYSQVHSLDPRSKTIYLGNGTSFSYKSLPKMYRSIVGTGIKGFSGDGGLARFAKVNNPQGIAKAPDGSIYIADAGNNRIRKVDPNGTISTFAGNGLSGHDGDNGNAVDASLSAPQSVAIARDGTILVADTGNHCIRRVDTVGKISTYLGKCGQAGATTYGPIVDNLLTSPTDLVLGINGNLSFKSGPFVFTVYPNEYIYPSFYGNGRISSYGEDDDLLIADSEKNTIGRFWGYQPTIYSGGQVESDFAKLGDARIAGASYAVRSKTGEIVFYEKETKKIRYLHSSGWIHPLIGYARMETESDYATGSTATIGDVSSMLANEDGSLFVVDAGLNKISIFAEPELEIRDNKYFIPSKDGSEIYLFDMSGVHLQTLYAKTGAVKYSFLYDQGYLTSVTDAFGNKTELVRSGSRVSQIVGPFGQATNLGYDGNGYLSSITSPGGKTSAITYTADGLMTSFKKPKGNTSYYQYSELGALVKETNPAGGTQMLERIGQLYTKYTTGLGKTFTIWQDSDVDGFEKETEDAKGATDVVSVYSGFDSNAYKDGSYYEGRQQFDSRLRGAAQYTGYIANWAATDYFTNTFVSREYSYPSKNIFDFVMTQKNTDFDGRMYVLKYDSANRTYETISPEGVKVSLVTDQFERPVKHSEMGLAATHTTYFANGKISSVTRGDRTTHFQYDSVGRVVRVIDPLNRQVEFGYDSSNRLVSKKLPDGRVVSYGYDLNSNLTALKPPARSWHEFAFGGLDLLGQYAPPENGSVRNISKYIYNDDREIVSEHKASGIIIDYQYEDGTHRPLMARSRDGSSRREVAYLSSGKVSDVYSSDSVKLAYQYNGNLPTALIYSGSVEAIVENTYSFGRSSFNVNSQRVNGEIVDRIYDKDTKLVSNGPIALAYSQQNALLESMTIGVLQESYQYNEFGEIIDRLVTHNGSQLYREAYLRDKLGRITTKTVNTGNSVAIWAYRYDLAGRLVEVNQADVSSKQYQYDEQGNRLGFGAVYDAEDRMISSGGYQFTYTANGELASKMRPQGGGVDTYSYDAFGALKGVALADGKSISYLLDGYGRRVVRMVNGTVTSKYIYDLSGALVAELDSSNLVKSRFLYATQSHSPDAMVKDGIIYKYVKDQLGSVIAVVNSENGAILQQLRYDENGVVLSDSNPGYQPFGYAGGLYDTSTKLVRFGARDYDAEVGRWTTKDPILFMGGTSNLYQYAHGDPINLIDPSGLDPGQVFKTEEAAAVDAINFVHNKSISENVEYGGWVYWTDSGYVATLPNTSKDKNGTNLGPKPITATASYHTHGRYDPDPNVANDRFSITDVKGDLADGVNGYVGLFDRSVWKQINGVFSKGLKCPKD